MICALRRLSRFPEHGVLSWWRGTWEAEVEGAVWGPDLMADSGSGCPGHEFGMWGELGGPAEVSSIETPSCGDDVGSLEVVVAPSVAEEGV